MSRIEVRCCLDSCANQLIYEYDSSHSNLPPHHHPKHKTIPHSPSYCPSGSVANFPQFRPPRILSASTQIFNMKPKMKKGTKGAASDEEVVETVKSPESRPCQQVKIIFCRNSHLQRHPFPILTSTKTTGLRNRTAPPFS